MDIVWKSGNLFEKWREGQIWFHRLTGQWEQVDTFIQETLQHGCVRHEGDIWNYTKVVFLFFLKWYLDNLMKVHNFILLEICGCKKKIENIIWKWMLQHVSHYSLFTRCLLSSSLLLMSEALSLWKLALLIKCVSSVQDLLTVASDGFAGAVVAPTTHLEP